MSGRLVYLVGASGVGKDSVLRGLREAIGEGDRIVVAHRYITRKTAHGGENHVALSTVEFQTRLAAGCFALHWESHGFHYGIGREIDDWLAKGLDVVINGSRAHWPLVRGRYPGAQLVEITASAEAIRNRMAARGRESEAEISARMQRNDSFEVLRLEGAWRISNDGSVEEAVAGLLEWLRREPADSV